jgi:hypothetical protein
VSFRSTIEPSQPDNPDKTQLASDRVSPRPCPENRAGLVEERQVGSECAWGLELLLLSGVTAWLRSVCVPDHLAGTHTMLRQPIHGFAKRVDDTVARVTAILQRRPDLTAEPKFQQDQAVAILRRQPER